MKKIPFKQIRANYNENTIRVYQAYSETLANSIMKNNSFLKSSFKVERMTWIKPSFLWMMYRSGWATKDHQTRILAIDITREGFEWALKHSLLSHFDTKIYKSMEDWKSKKETTPVRIQWDPERDIYLNKLDYRSIQIGLSKEAVEKYISSWVVNIEDITKMVHRVKGMIDLGVKEDVILDELSEEVEYGLDLELRGILGMED